MSPKKFRARLQEGHRPGGLFFPALALWLAVACAPAGSRSIEADPAPDADQEDTPPSPLQVYSKLDFIVGNRAFPAVGRFVYLPGPGDSTYAILTLSFPNSALRFRREPPGLLARYRVTVTVRDSLVTYDYLDETQEVRVRTYRETSRGDESVVFQGLFKLRPGDYRAGIQVRDLGSGSAFLTESAMSVPIFKAPTITAPIIAYRVQQRTDPAVPPSLILSPRATIAMGDPGPSVYLESYREGDESPILELLVEDRVIWADTLSSSAPPGSLNANVLSIDSAILPPGNLMRLRARLGELTSNTATLLVALGSGWLFADHQEMMSYLRYAGTPAQLDSLRRAAPGERARRLHVFWGNKDPDPDTPENEFFEAYFRRIRDANDRFSELAVPGWLTDRAAVYVTLGPPDEVVRRLDAERGPGSSQVWLYNRSLGFELRLVFVDESGAGGYSLTGDSRRAFFEAVERLFS